MSSRMASKTTLNWASYFLSRCSSFFARSAFEASIWRKWTNARMIWMLTWTARLLRSTLDSMATPAAFLAGTVVSAAAMGDLPPIVKWTTAVIAGGGVAGLMQGVTAVLRAHSTVLTGGLGNSAIATVENGGAIVVSLLALTVPLLALLLVIAFCWIAVRLLRRLLSRTPPPPDPH